MYTTKEKLYKWLLTYYDDGVSVATSEILRGLPVSRVIEDHCWMIDMCARVARRALVEAIASHRSGDPEPDAESVLAELWREFPPPG